MTDTKKGSDMNVSPDDSIMDFLDKVVDGSVGTSEAQIVDIMRALPSGQNTKKILAVAIMASMNVKSSVEKTIKRGAVTMPETLMTGESPNMSVLATIGHLLMTADDSEFTKKGLMKKAKYSESIGGAKDITKFAVFRDASSIRTTILRKYSENLSSYDTKVFLKVAKPLFPDLFHTNSVARTFGMLTKAVKAVIGRTYGYLWFFAKWSVIITAFFTLFTLFEKTKAVSDTAVIMLDPTSVMAEDITSAGYAITLESMLLREVVGAHYTIPSLAVKVLLGEGTIGDKLSEIKVDVMAGVTTRLDRVSSEFRDGNPMDLDNIMSMMRDSTSTLTDKVKTYISKGESYLDRMSGVITITDDELPEGTAEFMNEGFEDVTSSSNPEVKEEAAAIALEDRKEEEITIEDDDDYSF
jgi:uncharacterized protein involved in tellurium resistance